MCPERMQKFLMRPGTPSETAVRVYKRYLRLEPTHAEEYIAYLKAQVRPSLLFGTPNAQRALAWASLLRMRIVLKVMVWVFCRTKLARALCG